MTERHSPQPPMMYQPAEWPPQPPQQPPWPPQPPYGQPYHGPQPYPPQRPKSSRAEVWILVLLGFVFLWPLLLLIALVGGVGILVAIKHIWPLMILAAVLLVVETVRRRRARRSQ